MIHHLLYLKLISKKNLKNVSNFFNEDSIHCRENSSMINAFTNGRQPVLTAMVKYDDQAVTWYGQSDCFPSRGEECYHKNNITPRRGRGLDNARNWAKDPFWEGSGPDLAELRTVLNNQLACSVCHVAEMPGRDAANVKPTSC